MYGSFLKCLVVQNQRCRDVSFRVARTFYKLIIKIYTSPFLSDRLIIKEFDTSGIDNFFLELTFHACSLMYYKLQFNESREATALIQKGSSSSTRTLTNLKMKKAFIGQASYSALEV